MKKVAVLLCGSGYLDGSEIRESVATLWALSREKILADCFALDDWQKDVIDCSTGKPMNEKRNQFVEAARIARGKISPISKLIINQYDGIILPGGFGAAKNLCSFASEGAKAKVQPNVQKVLESFHKENKPIGAICIAPAILALTFAGKQLELTVGAKSEASGEIEKLGHKHMEKKVNECHVDKKHRIVSTPAYMYDDAQVHEVFQGIEALVRAMVTIR